MLLVRDTRISAKFGASDYCIIVVYRCFNRGMMNKFPLSESYNKFETIIHNCSPLSNLIFSIRVDEISNNFFFLLSRFLSKFESINNNIYIHK